MPNDILIFKKNINFLFTHLLQHLFLKILDRLPIGSYDFDRDAEDEQWYRYC